MSHHFIFFCRGSLNRLIGRPCPRSPELSIKQLSWHAVLLHPDDMSCLTKLGLEEQCFSACCLDSIQDLKIGDLLLPADAEDGTKSTHMKLLQLHNAEAVQCPYLAPIEKIC